MLLIVHMDYKYGIIIIIIHHQPINVPTAGAQAFLLDYPQGGRAITHHAGPVRIGGCKYGSNDKNIECANLKSNKIRLCVENIFKNYNSSLIFRILKL
jgi:hypothetical protein